MLVKIQKEDKQTSSNAEDNKKFQQNFAQLNQRLKKTALTKK